MSTHSGSIVITKTGKYGRTKNTDSLINGKVVVYIEDEKREPVMTEKGQQLKMLCNGNELRRIGFVD